MNLTINCVDLSACFGRNFAAVWMFILYILNFIYAGYSIEITSYTCGEGYDMDLYNKRDVTYYGRNILYNNPCSVKFTKTSYKQYLCIASDNIQLDCETSLEYHEAFVKNYIDPEIKMSCNSIVDNEWCPSQYQDTVFIVIRKSSHQTSDNIRLRIYLKDVAEEGFSGSGFSSTIFISIIIPVVFVLVCSCMCAIIRRNQKHDAARPQIAYQTTSGTVDIGQTQARPHQTTGLTYPNRQTYQPVQQSALQGHYNVHPMQIAYPAQQGATAPNQTMYSHPGNPGQNYSSAPPEDINAPPPSYESLMIGKQ